MSFWYRPRIPRPCGCGDTHGNHCNEIGLGNHRKFPPFALLPDFDDVDLDYYSAKDDESSWFSPSRHWILLGEIIENLTDFVRPRSLLETKFGEQVLVNFHLEDAPTPAYFSWNDIKPGRTMCILYAKKKAFMDMNRGVRQEYSRCSMVFPANLGQLSKDCTSIELSLVESARRCFQCERTTRKDEVFALKRCSKCQVAVYCSKECQVLHWKATHKKLCQHTRTLSKMMSLNFAQFEGFVYWDFDLEPMPTPTEQQARHRQALFDLIRRHGGEPLSKQERLAELLSATREKRLEDDPISSRLSGLLCTGGFHKMMEEERPELLSGVLSSNVFFQGLQSLAEKYASETSQRVHVVDGGLVGAGMSGSLGETLNDISMSVLFFSLPQWQLETRISQILWAVEVHHYFASLELFPTDIWEIANQDNDGFLSSSRRNPSDRCFFHNEIEVVAGVADTMATTFPESLVIRVLRAYPSPARLHGYPEIASRSTAENMVTLWIRENSAAYGRFRPLDPSLSLSEQLTDVDGSLISNMLGLLG